MASSNNITICGMTSLVIKFLMFLALIDNVALADVSERYHVVKNQQNVTLCANTTTTPGERLKMVRSPIVCSGKCSSDEECVGFNYRSRERVCELFDFPGPMKFGVVEQCSYFAVSSIYCFQSPTITPILNKKSFRLKQRHGNRRRVYELPLPSVELNLTKANFIQGGRVR